MNPKWTTVNPDDELTISREQILKFKIKAGDKLKGYAIESNSDHLLYFYIFRKDSPTSSKTNAASPTSTSTSNSSASPKHSPSNCWQFAREDGSRGQPPPPRFLLEPQPAATQRHAAGSHTVCRLFVVTRATLPPPLP
jgi:hypothetical protein